MRISDWSSDVCSSDLEADRRDHGWKKAGSSFRSERRSWMEAKRRRCCKDTAAFKVGFGRTGTQLLRFAPEDRKSVVEGKRVSVRVDLGGRRSIKKKIR